jgi:hypothetical protein
VDVAFAQILNLGAAAMRRSSISLASEDLDLSATAAKARPSFQSGDIGEATLRWQNSAVAAG